MERPQGRGLDGAAPRPGEGASAARLGGAEAGRLVAPGAAAAARARRGARGAGGRQQGLAAAVARAKAAHPGRPVEVWATDEHRLGLKPIRRRVRAPVGARPVALGRHRHRWLQVAAFVPPTSGEAVRYPATGLSKPVFEALLARFARRTGAGRERHIILVLDNAGWHRPEGLAVPEGISLVFPPPCSPELQPAERLWPWWMRRSSTGTSPRWMRSTPPSPRAAVSWTPMPSSRTPTSTGGPGQPRRADQPDSV